jgi:hypothetical protein
MRVVALIAILGLNPRNPSDRRALLHQSRREPAALFLWTGYARQWRGPGELVILRAGDRRPGGAFAALIGVEMSAEFSFRDEARGLSEDGVEGAELDGFVGRHRQRLAGAVR